VPPEIARGQPPGSRGMLLGLDRLDFFPMLRRCSCVIALAVMLVGLPTAQAADTTLTLACQGTELAMFYFDNNPGEESSEESSKESSEESNGLRDAASDERQQILWPTT